MSSGSRIWAVHLWGGGAFICSEIQKSPTKTFLSAKSSGNLKWAVHLHFTYATGLKNPQLRLFERREKQAKLARQMKNHSRQQSMVRHFFPKVFSAREDRLYLMNGPSRFKQSNTPSNNNQCFERPFSLFFQYFSAREDNNDSLNNLMNGQSRYFIHDILQLFSFFQDFSEREPGQDISIWLTNHLVLYREFHK